MNESQVSFRSAMVEMEDLTTGQKEREMDIIEIRFPDGKVSAFPATDVSPETGQRYCDMYAGKYGTFKSGGPDPDRVAELEQGITERKAELDTLRKRPADDNRVQKNLGYGGKRGQKIGDNTADNGIQDEPAANTGPALGQPKSDDERK